MTLDFIDDYDDLGPIPPTSTFKGGSYKPCYETHPQLKLGKGILVGGSCSKPVIDTADVYVGLDYTMKNFGSRYPWQPVSQGPEEISFRITDGCAPKDPENFVAMIKWLKKKLEAGQTVHVGCIGGHGRTGMVVSALVREINGTEDAITWTRENYCKKAVESVEQVEFLNKYFGIKKVDGSKVFQDWINKDDGKKKATSNRTHKQQKYYQEKAPKALPDYRNRDYIPGTHLERTKGPRDLADHIQTSVYKYLRHGNPNSIWAEYDV